MSREITGQPETVGAEPSYDLTSLTPTQRQQWRESGEWPSAAPSEPPAKPEAKPAESEPATKQTSEPGEKPGKTAGESEPPEQQGKQQDTPEERAKRDRDYQNRRHTRQVNTLNRQLGEAQARIRQLESERSANGEKAPESEPGRNTRPKREDFESYEAWEKADEKWIRDDERGKTAAESKRQAAEREQAARADTWQKQVKAFKKANPERAEGFDDSVMVVDDAFGENATVTDAILESQHGPAIVDYLAEHEDELSEILEKSPTAQLRAILKLEDKLAGAGTASPTKKISSAPKPPSEVGTKTVVTEDEADAALGRGDYRSFRDRENARDAERFAKGLR